MLAKIKNFSRVFFVPCFLTEHRLEQSLIAVLKPAAAGAGNVSMSVAAIDLMKACLRQGNMWALMWNTPAAR